MEKQPVIIFLNREQVDFLDKIGKDSLFSKRIKLSRNKIIGSLVELLTELEINGKDISSAEELKQRIKEKIKFAEAQEIKRPPSVKTQLIEKREFPRLKANLEVQYRILESLSPHQITTTEDICEKGIRINLPGYIEPKTHLELTINIPDEPEPIKVIGRVVWVKKALDKKSFATGIHLVHIEEKDKEKFYKYAFCGIDEKKK